jgi:tetratricopeptide (TPR) repeat protein
MLTAALIILYGLNAFLFYLVFQLKNKLSDKNVLRGLLFDIPHASRLFKMNELDQLIDYCQKIREHAPNDDHVNWYLGLAYFRKGDLIESRKFFQEAVSINPNVESEAQAYFKSIDQQLKSPIPKSRKH